MEWYKEARWNEDVFLYKRTEKSQQLVLIVSKSDWDKTFWTIAPFDKYGNINKYITIQGKTISPNGKSFIPKIIHFEKPEEAKDIGKNWYNKKIQKEKCKT
jgi:hypothetical protein